MTVFIISELGSNWRFCSEVANQRFCPHGAGVCKCELDNAYRMIRAAKECGADAAKFQWVSDYKQLMKRRDAPDSEERAYKYVHFPAEWLPLLKAECDRVGIAFGCTVYLPQDVEVLRPYLKWWKVAAKESRDRELINEIFQTVNSELPIYISRTVLGELGGKGWMAGNVSNLWCVSKYPTPPEELSLQHLKWNSDNEETSFPIHGLSDHTANVLTGAVAVGAGARIIESHVRLHDTPKECPDFPHSLILPEYHGPENKTYEYGQYVDFIRTAERML